MKLDSSLARNSAAYAISSGSQPLGIADAAWNWDITAGGITDDIGVFTSPGHSVLQRIFHGARSIAAERVSARSPHFEAE